MRYFSFTRWLTVKEGFNSLTHYKDWLLSMNRDEANKTDLFYHEKYEYWDKNLHTERD